MPIHEERITNLEEALSNILRDQLYELNQVILDVRGELHKHLNTPCAHDAGYLAGGMKSRAGRKENL